MKQFDPFDVSSKKLTTLPKWPEKVACNINCSKNNLTNLIGSPNEVIGSFNCSENNLTDLTGAPYYIGRDFECSCNNLTSLIGAPKLIKGFLNFSANPNLLDISDIWNSDVEGYVCFNLYRGMAILPLAKFNKLYPVIDRKLTSVPRKAGTSKQDIIDFQYDLIENGFGEFARWKPD